jgi:hypothetical protein
MERESVMEFEALEYIEKAVDAACDTGAQTASAVALVSIAISLKRIADQVAGVPYNYAPGADNVGHRMGLVDGIMHAIEQGLLAASQRG